MVLVTDRYKIIGGDEGDRTPDLGVANAALSQLSYIPTKFVYFTRLKINGQL